MPPFAPPFAGNTRRAYVVATASPALPLTIVAGSNDTFQFNSVPYTLPAGTYGGIGALADAVNASSGGSGATLLNNKLVFTVSHSAPTKLKATSVVAGAITQAFAVGATHDGLVAVGFANGQSLANGDPID